MKSAMAFQNMKGRNDEVDPKIFAVEGCDI